jgi:hypothetical protein
VDVGLNTGAGRADFAPLFDGFLFGVSEDLTVKHLPFLIDDDLVIAVQSGFFDNPFLSHTYVAEPAKAMRVDIVKGQFFISEIEKDFKYDTTRHEFGTHALSDGALRFTPALFRSCRICSQMVGFSSMMLLIITSSLLCG